MIFYWISCATYNGDGQVVIFGSRKVNWREFVPRVFRAANALISLGVRKGEPVTFMLHNTPEFLEVNFGIQVAGAILVPMNYRFVPKEVEYQANHCEKIGTCFQTVGE